MADEGVVVWYNPRCSKCRGAEELLAEHGVPAQRLFYLDDPPRGPRSPGYSGCWGRRTRGR